MKIALYSSRGRPPFENSRQSLKPKIKNIDVDTIRQIRQDLLYEHPTLDETYFEVEERAKKGLTSRHPANLLDFYNLSELRDLFFHEQESQFTLDRINELLPDLTSNFLGFEIDPHVKLKVETQFDSEAIHDL